MSDTALTPEQEALIAESIRKRKPYLLRIEEEVADVVHGSIKVEIMIRNGSVDKMNFIQIDKSWLRDKAA